MTASERMAGMVEDCQNAAHLCAVHGADDPHDCEDAASALLAAIGEIERDRDAQAAEVARLAGVARDACDVAERVASLLDAQSDMATRRGWSRAGRSDIAAIRSAIPTPDPADDGDCTACGGPSCACVDDATPDPAAFVAAVERFGQARAEWSRLDHDADEDEAIRLHTEMLAARAALLAMGGVK